MTEKKLKICFVTSMHDWNDDRIFERAAVGLASLGHEVTYVAPGPKDMIAEGVRIKALPKRERLGKHLKGPGEAYRAMKKIEADLYYFHNPNMMFQMRRWARKGHAVFADIHENYEVRVDALPLPKWIRNILVKRYRKFENRICSAYAGLTVVTESMRKKMESSGVPILILDNVPSLKRLANIKLADQKAERPTIITSGNNSPARNCMKAVEALPEIVKAIPNVEMKFVGRFTPTSYEQDLNAKAAELGVSANFKTEGMLPWLENFKRISSAHIGCVFYNDNLNNRVTLPNRLYEYMYVGLAVLGEEFPEVKNVVDKTGCGATVNSQSPKDIAEKAISLLQSPEKLEKAMKNSREAVLNKYNFENALVELDAFFRKYTKA
jgi:glycosyltransferase involved in cell wall biosynthesis